MKKSIITLVDFRKPETLEELAQYIGITESALKDKVESDNIEKFFFKHEIPRKNQHRRNAKRIVWEVQPYIADSYKSFTRRFDFFACDVTDGKYPSSSAYGYVRGRSTLDNATPHCNAKMILHADIRDFFASISRFRIKSLFLNFCLNENIASALSKFVTIYERLSLGLHSSLMLSNLICIELDIEFQELAKKFECTYTRYADDITISGNRDLPSKENVEFFLQKYKFNLAKEKFRITRRGQSHYVTGLSVDGDRPRAPRKMKKRLRQELYYCNKYGIEQHIERVDVTKLYNYIQRGINRIDGTVKYIYNIEKNSLPNIRKEWVQLLKIQGLEVSYETREKSVVTECYNFYIDESEIDFNNKKYLALSLVQVREKDIKEIEYESQKVYRNHMIDPFAAGKKEPLQKKGLHYADAPEDLRKAYVDVLATFPLKSYIVYQHLKQFKEYEDVYLGLLKSILPYRLMGCDGAACNLFFEQNSKVSSEKIKKCTSLIFDDLMKANNRRPRKMKVDVVKKQDNNCFSLPDFILGVFSKYARSTSERDSRLFEKIRDKCRVIVDAEKNWVFSRKRPFTSWR